MSVSNESNMTLVSVLSVTVRQQGSFSLLVQTDDHLQSLIFTVHHTYKFDKWKCLIPRRKDWFRVLLTVSRESSNYSTSMLKQVVYAGVESAGATDLGERMVL